MHMQPKIKSKVFINLLPTIRELKKEGYSHKQVTQILRENYQLDLSENLFSLYMSRYGKGENSTLEKDLSIANKEIITETEHQPELSNDQDSYKFNDRDFGFLSPQHKAKVQAETESFFRGNQKVGLRNR